MTLTDIAIIALAEVKRMCPECLGARRVERRKKTIDCDGCWVGSKVRMVKCPTCFGRGRNAHPVRHEHYVRSLAER